MGVSTDGILCYGFLLGEIELPWEDVERWWAFEIHGDKFHQTAENPYDEHGEYREGFTKDDPRIGPYHDERLRHQELHQPPVEFVNSCSCSCSVWIAAVPGTVTTARRGYPEALSSEQMIFVPGARVVLLREFLKTHLLPTEEAEDVEVGEPEWWLGSFWEA